MVFTTAAASSPPSVSGGGASVSVSRVIVNADVQSGASPATVSFEYGLSTSYGTSVAAADVSVIQANTTHNNYAVFTGLSPGTLYHFRCKATNAQGTAYSSDGTFTTKQMPVLITGPANQIGDLGAALNATVDPRGGSLYSVKFEFGTSTSYGAQMAAGQSYITGTGAVAVSATVYDLLPGTLYHYRVTGADDAQAEYHGPDQTFTTTPAIAPTAGTVQASATTKTASLSCWPVSAGSSATNAVFQYGPTTSYGNSTAVSGTIPAGSTYANPSISLSGLLPGTTFHARCVLTNAQGTVYSSDISFTTFGLPTATTNAATNVTDLSAVLNGSVNPKGADLQTSFELGASTAYGVTVNTTPYAVSGNLVTPLTGTINGLLPGTTYHYRTKTQYSSDQAVVYYGPDMVFTTLAAATPPLINGVQSYSVSATKASLQALSVQAGSSTATIVWDYGTTTAYGSMISASPVSMPYGTNGMPLGMLTGLVQSTTYHYRCRATNSQGTAVSGDATFTTLAAPAVTTTPATSVSDMTVVLHGTATSPSGSSVLRFEIDTSTAYGYYVNAAPYSINGASSVPVSSSVSGLLPNTTYHYRIVAIDAPGASFYGTDQTFTTGAPATAPTASLSFAFSSGSTSPTAMSVRANFNTGSSPTTVVIQYGLTAAYGSQSTLPTVFPVGMSFNNQECILSGLSPSTTYHYRVVVTNGQGSGISGDGTFTTRPPPAVTTEQAYLEYGFSAFLSGTYNKQGGTYSVSFDYGPTSAYGFSAAEENFGQAIIFPSTAAYDPLATYATVAPLTPETLYHYRLKLTDSFGNSFYGADATFTSTTSLASWRNTYFNSPNNSGSGADTASPSGDGIPNLMKYALDLDPLHAAAVPQPVLRSYGGNHYLSLSFKRDGLKNDITYEVQSADSPAGPWTSIATSAGGAVTTGPGFVAENPYYIGGGSSQLAAYAVSVEVHDTVSMETSPHRFMRLKVTR